MAKDVKIVLKKEGSKDITVKCPRTVKLSPVIAALYILWGCPPLWVKPIDWKEAFLSFLAEKGLLSKEEFDAQKAKLLGL